MSLGNGLRNSTIGMRVDKEFRNFCRDMGVSRKVTFELAKNKTILSELINNEKFKKDVEKMFKQYKGIV